MIGHRKGLARAIDGRSIDQSPRLPLSLWNSVLRVNSKTGWGKRLLRYFPGVTRKLTGERLEYACDCDGCSNDLARSRSVTLYQDDDLIAGFCSDTCLQQRMKQLKKSHN
jgi:hypothetical protein